MWTQFTRADTSTSAFSAILVSNVALKVEVKRERRWRHYCRDLGNPDWAIESEDHIALHFAEFHSDKTSRKDTALISVTHDPIRAIKAAYQEWECGSFHERDATQIFISVIQSTDSYFAKDLKDRALATPLCSRLSREARSWLNEPKEAQLYDSEGLFLSRIAKEQPWRSRPESAFRICLTESC